MIHVATSEGARQLDLITSTLGVSRSGHSRYGAAMYFYIQGMIGADALEVYRICAPLDHEDPIKILEAQGLAGDFLAATGSRPKEENAHGPS